MYTNNLEDLDASSVSFAGGKGAMLGELVKLTPELDNVEVPRGIVLNTSAFAAWMAGAGVKDANIGKALKAAGRDITAITEISNMLKEKLIESDYYPEEMQEEIAKFLTKGKKYAVRSSAVGEDGDAASFAGQNDSFLNCKVDDVKNFTKQVWISSFAPRSLYYRVVQELYDEPIRQAVVIQEMVNPEFAGVAFSADPRTGRRDRGLVEFVTGLGDALVSGSVTPTTIAFKHDWSTQFPYPAIEQVAKCVVALEKKLDWPVDMEWAWKDKLYLLQARPITTLPPEMSEYEAQKFEMKHEKYGQPLMCGEPFSPGSKLARGFISREQAKEMIALKAKGEYAPLFLNTRILAVEFTTPDDLPIMEQCVGVVVSKGGITSHAAIVCRELHKPCIRVDDHQVLLDKYNNHDKPVFIDGNLGAIYQATIKEFAEMIAPSLKKS